MDLAGALVRLRAYRADDAEAIVAGIADPDVAQNLAWWSWNPYGLDDAREWLRRRDPDEVRWAIEIKDGGRFIGGTGLRLIDRRSRNCQWGIWTAPPEVWGQGYGTEACVLATRFAFDHLGMEKVWLSVLEGNARGRRAYEKAGYRVEGTLPRDTLADGRLVTVHVMSAFRDDPLYGEGGR